MRLAAAIRRFHEGYFATCERSPKTLAAYEVDLRQFSEFAGRGRRLELLEAETIELWSRNLLDRGYAPASIRRKMASLRVFFLYWVRKKALAESPFWRVRLSLGRTQQLPKCLTESEMRALLKCARRRAQRSSFGAASQLDGSFRALRDLAIIDLLFATGLRVGEAVRLNLGDFDATERALVVRGKGGRMRLAFLADSQSLETQAAYHHQRKRARSTTEALFLNRFGARLSCQGVANVVAGLAGQAAIPRRVTPHMLRHTVATLLLRNGVDLRIVQEFLGHASLATTQRYTHISKEHLVATLRKSHPSLTLH